MGNTDNKSVQISLDDKWYTVTIVADGRTPSPEAESTEEVESGSLPEAENESGLPIEYKSMNITAAKKLGIQIDDSNLRRTVAAKYVSPDTLFHYAFLWGDPAHADLESEYFTRETDFWDNIMGKSARPLTWDHAMDETMKANPVIGQTVEWGDDDIGRWAISHMDRHHVYRKAVDQLIEMGVIGTSSDSAAQYVERVANGKSTWLKRWPWFASALTDTPCEYRMVGSVSYFKSLGLTLPDSEASVLQTRAMVEKAHRTFSYIQTFGV